MSSQKRSRTRIYIIVILGGIIGVLVLSFLLTLIFSSRGNPGCHIVCCVTIYNKKALNKV